MSILLNFIILPPSLWVKVMSVFSFVSLANGGLSEVKGRHARYSKFLEANSDKKSRRENKIASRIGMLIAYTPALIACLASLVLLRDSGTRSLLLSSVLSLHFFKRVFEVLFVHRYSGTMLVDTVIMISVSYITSAATMIYAQHLSQGMVEPENDLRYLGIILFLLGITGNFYHHYLLSRLRKDDKGYKIPEGALFRLVVCPHYLFEIIMFIGVALISQTVYAFSFAFGSMIYLMGRSYATRKWYLSKFENFPRGVRALIPYVF